MDLLTSGVMSGIIGAESQMKIANVSMAVYSKEASKRNPDQDKLNRALGYTNDSIKAAMKESKKAGKELEKAQIAAKEQEKVERAAQLEKAIKEKVNDTKDESKVNKSNKDGDTIEITDAGKVALSNENDVKTEQTKNAEVDVTTADNQASEVIPKTYSNSGKATVIVASIEHKISVKV